MKVLLALSLLALAFAACSLRGDCTPSLIQQQQQINANQMTSSLNSAMFESVNQVMERVFRQLYGEDETEVMMKQLQVCERTRSNSILGVGVRMSLFGTQLLTLCNQEDPNFQANRMFSQVINIILPLIAPCTLDRDIAADLLLAEMAVLSQARQSNVTGFEVGSLALLNLTEHIFTFTDGLMTNFSNSIQSLTERNLLDDTQAPQMVDLMQSTVSGAEQVYRDLLTQMPEDPAGALANAENAINRLEVNIETRLRYLDVPEKDIHSLSETLRNITSELTAAMTETLTDAASTEGQLAGFTSQLTAMTQESAQILVDLVTQNIDEFCAARNSTSSNST